MSEIHERMPVILEHENYDKWMSGTPDEAWELVKPAPEGILKKRIVNKGLNVSRNEGEWLLDPKAKPPAEDKLEAVGSLL